LALAQSLASKALASAKAVAVDKVVAAELKTQGVIGVAIGIIQNGEIVYLKGYGLSDRDNRTPVTEHTVFSWGSNSKPLTAVAAMQLVEKKLLDLDADVRTYVPEFPDKGHVITTRQLLSHQSGIPHYSNVKIVPTKLRYSTDQPFIDPVFALDIFNRSPLLFAPGEKVSYSSYAYILLSAVVQRAGKETFQTQINRRIAKPLGMKSLQLDIKSGTQRNWAIGYTKNTDGRVVPAKEEANYWKHGAGGFKSDIEDFALWAQGLLNRQLLYEETEKLMWSRQTLSNGEEICWGLGFSIADQGGLKVSHNGSNDGMNTRLVLYPRARHGIVVMSNCQFANAGAISTAIYKVLCQK
jgi:CubicO group peptidase (beta-lactamase class C family)